MPKVQNAKDKKNQRTTMFNCLTRKKSTILATTDSIFYLRGAYMDFSRETTLHGLKHTVMENYHWFERLLWFLLTILAFYGAVYCALSQFTRYSSEPIVLCHRNHTVPGPRFLILGDSLKLSRTCVMSTIQWTREYPSASVLGDHCGYLQVSLQRDYSRWWTTFPAITVCFMERVQPNKARETIENIWNITESSDPDKYKYYYGFIELISDVSFRSNLQNFWKYQTDDSVQNIDLKELALSVHPNYTISVFKSQNNYQLQWMPVITEDGVCMSYNSEYAEHQFALEKTKWRRIDQLLECHYHSGECFVRVECFSPARFFIHSPFDISTAISNPTGVVASDEELVMDFKAVEIQAAQSVRTLSKEQRRCQYPDEWLSDSIRAYSFGLCQMLCRTRMALMFCGCRPFFFVKGASLGGTTALFVGASVLTVVETMLFLLRQIVSLVFDRKTPVRPFKP